VPAVLTRRADFARSEAAGGRGHAALELLNHSFSGAPAAGADGAPPAPFAPGKGAVRVLRELEDLGRLEPWLLKSGDPAAPTLLGSGCCAHLVAAVVGLDALNGSVESASAEAVAVPGVPHHCLIRTRAWADDPDMAGLEACLDVGYPWFFARDLPSSAPPTVVDSRGLAARWLDAVRVVAMASDPPRHDEALEALRLSAAAFPDAGVLRDAGVALAQTPGGGRAEDAKAYLRAFLEIAAADGLEGTDGYRTATEVLATLS